MNVRNNKKLRWPLGFVGAAALLLAQSALALPTYYCKAGPGIDLVNDGCVSGESQFYPDGGDGIYSNAGGGDAEAAVEAAILGATGSAVDISLYGGSDNDPGLFSMTGVPGTGGTWDVIDDSVMIAYITVKAANSFSLYDVQGANSGTWSTAGLRVKNKDSQPTVSHIRFWLGPVTDPGNPDPPNATPLPGTLALLGLSVLGLVARRRRS